MSSAKIKDVDTLIGGENVISEVALVVHHKIHKETTEGGAKLKALYFILQDNCTFLIKIHLYMTNERSFENYCLMKQIFSILDSYKRAKLLYLRKLADLPRIFYGVCFHRIYHLVHARVYCFSCASLFHQRPARFNIIYTPRKVGENFACT